MQVTVHLQEISKWAAMGSAFAIENNCMYIHWEHLKRGLAVAYCTCNYFLFRLVDWLIDCSCSTSSHLRCLAWWLTQQWTSVERHWSQCCCPPTGGRSGWSSYDWQWPPLWALGSRHWVGAPHRSGRVWLTGPGTYGHATYESYYPTSPANWSFFYLQLHVNLYLGIAQKVTWCNIPRPDNKINKELFSSVRHDYLQTLQCTLTPTYGGSHDDLCIL